MQLILLGNQYSGCFRLLNAIASLTSAPDIDEICSTASMLRQMCLFICYLKYCANNIMTILCFTVKLPSKCRNVSCTYYFAIIGLIMFGCAVIFLMADDMVQCKTAVSALITLEILQYCIKPPIYHTIFSCCAGNLQCFICQMLISRWQGSKIKWQNRQYIFNRCNIVLRMFMDMLYQSDISWQLKVNIFRFCFINLFAFSIISKHFGAFHCVVRVTDTSQFHVSNQALR